MLAVQQQKTRDSDTGYQYHNLLTYLHHSVRLLQLRLVVFETNF